MNAKDRKYHFGEGFTREDYPLGTLGVDAANDRLIGWKRVRSAVEQFETDSKVGRREAIKHLGHCIAEAVRTSTSMDNSVTEGLEDYASNRCGRSGNGPRRHPEIQDAAVRLAYSSITLDWSLKEAFDVALAETIKAELPDTSGFGCSPCGRALAVGVHRAGRYFDLPKTTNAAGEYFGAVSGKVCNEAGEPPEDVFRDAMDMIRRLAEVSPRSKEDDMPPPAPNTSPQIVAMHLAKDILRRVSKDPDCIITEGTLENCAVLVDSLISISGSEFDDYDPEIEGVMDGSHERTITLHRPTMASFAPFVRRRVAPRVADGEHPLSEWGATLWKEINALTPRKSNILGKHAADIEGGDDE